MKIGKIIIIIFLLHVSTSFIKAQTVSYWDGLDTSVWTNGNGTIGMPYLIESAGNLACLAKRVNEGTNYSGIYFKLTTNLNLGGGNWIPIGISTSNYFSGIFDGDYYTIDSLFINKTATANSFVGLFGIVQNSTIQKVILSNVQVNQTSASANIYTGGLIGATIGGDYIHLCSVLSGTIQSVSASGNKAYAGGIVGCSQFGVKNIKIENCTNAANIFANYALGGIVGMFNVTSTVADTLWLSSCSNSGLISGLPTSGNVYTGGVIGWLNLQRNNTECYIDNCSNTAYIKDSTHGGQYVYTGGLIGYVQNTASANTSINAYISNSWNSGKVENINTSMDFSVTTWSYVAGITGNITLYGVATMNYVNVYNTGEIYFLRRSPKTTSAVGGILGLMSTQLAGGAINLNQAYNTGNITLSSPDTSNYLTYSGGIVGWLYDLAGNYSINKCFNTGNIDNESFYSGGIVGYVGGFYSTGNIINNCYNSGNIKSKNTAGGISACYVHKSTGNSVTNCISVGTVKTIEGGSSAIAGTLGDSTEINLATCYYDRQITGLVRGASTFGSGSSCINDTIRYARQLVQLQLDTLDWYMENNLYPRLLSFKNNHEMILAATPVFFFCDTLENIYNTINDVNRSFKMGGKSGTFFHSSKSSVLGIVNNDSATVDPAGTDTIVFTSTYGTATRNINLIIKNKPLIDSNETLVLCENELPYVYRNQFIDEAGDYSYFSSSLLAADTNYTIHVVVNPSYDTIIVEFVSLSDFPYTFGTQTLDQPGTYQENFGTWQGCDSIVNLVLVFMPSDITLSICKISVNAENKNVIEWEKPLTTVISNFVIYRETNLTDVYEVIGIVDYDSTSCFVDLTANPSSKAYRYKIGGMTIYGNNTQISPYHQTIHLTINKGIGDIYNLIWSSYEGLEYNSYRLLKGSSMESMTVLSDIAGHLNSFTDEATGIMYYQIEIIPVDTCDYLLMMPSIYLKANSNHSNSIKSNIVCNQPSSILNVDYSRQIYVSPNPAQNYLDVKWADGLDLNEIIIYDMYGKVIKKEKLNGYARIDISSIAHGIYIVQAKNNDLVLGNYKIVKN